MPSSRQATTRIWGSWIDLPLALAVAALAAIAIAGPAADSPPEPDKVAVFMRAKLGHADRVLEGLAVADFDLIERAAQELSLASLDSNWQVLQTEDYVRQSAEFRRACDTLKEAARKKNLDGAALAWVDVTLKCVQCHKYVRDAD